ncbi:uncharacterized protein [Coffea arabica]|uniref:DUF659 domain-containing protein n=1 Tax=Coffea arabica TaxID=13443 RepID=A0A6P6VAK6_COFAR
MTIALWFYDACIPINAINSPFFQKAIDQIASMGHGYKGPSYHSLRVNLLRNAKRYVKLVVDSFRNTWAEIGCTIMGDGWKDTRQRPLINFLIYCPKGISFIKSVDASDIVTSAENLCNLFAKIVEMVGSNNVVHLVTDNAKAAGSLLSERYLNICWSPCAAHCINLILKDIGDMNDVKAIVSLASTVTVFIYNHKFTLNWLRKTTGWKEIIRPENWWKLYGCDAPNLQKLAIRILSQTVSSSGCERNWSVFERIHTKKRNRLEHQRLNDLVYVHYNLRLQHRFDLRKRSYDPIDYESIDKTEFWVIEEEQDGELICDEFEEELEELPKDDSQLVEDDESEVGEDNAIDLEAFQRRRLLNDDEDNDWLN